MARHLRPACYLLGRPQSRPGAPERSQFTVTIANAPSPKVYVTSLDPVTGFVMLALPSGLLHVFVCGGTGISMDWYMKAVDLRGKFINWVGKGDITKPTWQYLKSRVDNFRIDSRFKKGDVFVASGSIRQSNT